MQSTPAIEEGQPGTLSCQTMYSEESMNLNTFFDVSEGRDTDSEDFLQI